MDSNWRPANLRDKDFSALSPGVPPWMQKPIDGWIERATAPFNYDTDLRVSLASDFDMHAQMAEPLAAWAESYYLHTVLQKYSNKEVTIAFLDYLLAKLGAGARPDALESVLQQSGSVWMVSHRGDAYALEKRVPDGVVLAANETMAAAGSAGRLLAEAWHAQFGRSPDYEEAYEKAIKAVEEAGVGEVSPKNLLAGLGTMARDMEAQTTWRLPLGENPKHPTDKVAVMMVRSLWEGQESRHGGNGYRKPRPDESEAAVMLAVALVQWFTSGTLARR